MPTAWYVCPYDFLPRPGFGGVRLPAVSRYIPSVPNADGANWDEAEILGNSIVVKVIAPDAVHATIQADGDFLVIPHLAASIPAPQRNAIRTKLEALGYLTDEINGTGWTVTQLLALLTTAASLWELNAARDAITVLPGRRPAPKTVAQIEARLPG